MISAFKKNTHVTGGKKAFRIRTKASPKEPEKPIDISSKEPMHISQEEPSESARKHPRNRLKKPYAINYANNLTHVRSVKSMIVVDLHTRR